MKRIVTMMRVMRRVWMGIDPISSEWAINKAMSKGMNYTWRQIIGRETIRTGVGMRRHQMKLSGLTSYAPVLHKLVSAIPVWTDLTTRWTSSCVF
jgi:hypothetical protein